MQDVIICAAVALANTFTTKTLNTSTLSYHALLWPRKLHSRLTIW